MTLISSFSQFSDSPELFQQNFMFACGGEDCKIVVCSGSTDKSETSAAISSNFERKELKGAVFV